MLYANRYVHYNFVVLTIFICWFQVRWGNTHIWIYKWVSVESFFVDKRRQEDLSVHPLHFFFPPLPFSILLYLVTFSPCIFHPLSPHPVLRSSGSLSPTTFHLHPSSLNHSLMSAPTFLFPSLSSRHLQKYVAKNPSCRKVKRWIKMHEMDCIMAGQDFLLIILDGRQYRGTAVLLFLYPALQRSSLPCPPMPCPPPASLFPCLPCPVPIRPALPRLCCVLSCLALPCPGLQNPTPCITLPFLYSCLAFPSTSHRVYSMFNDTNPYCINYRQSFVDNFTSRQTKVEVTYFLWC